ncbi:MAG: hypothetical protein RL693_98 [Verrucomicrobiota bacterium]|jgi:anthranilate/para-aminobenzoate synthase component I
MLLEASSTAPSLLSPAETASALQAREGLAFMDSVTAQGHAFSLIASEPEEIYQGNIFKDADALRRVLKQHQQTQVTDPGVPTAGLFGWVGFDGQYVFGRYEKCSAFQHGTQSWLDASSQLHPAALPDRGDTGTSGAIVFEPQMDKKTFCELVKRAQRYIEAGDIYQVNLSYPWKAAWPEGLDSWTFYERLREASPTPYGAYFNLGGTQVFSASPECFIRISGRHIVTRPIKGTRPRGESLDSDARYATELVNSPKERAELIMITDLERNDVGQVCEFGSVHVSELLKLERYAQVQHLVSTVEGTLRQDVDQFDAFLACFPGGSISGAPKKRALEIIHELEPHQRGLYTGAIGYFGFNGESQFSIAIRTAWRTGDTVQFHTGAGIVADSDPEREWEETQHKAAGLLQAAH